MTAKFSYAVWAAVSTAEQATENHQSLKEQERRARAFGIAQGGIETSGPYILDGYSRTGYEGLSEAAAEIPPLKQALDDLDNNKYNVLICENFDRFGDIALMLSVRFKKQKAQLISTSQSGSITPAELYNPYRDNALSTNIGFQIAIQGYRINKLQSGWQDNIPARVDRGLLPTNNIPFGYRYTDKQRPPEIVPEEAEILIQAKDWMLEGVPYLEIARRANEKLGLKWDHKIPKRLCNSFYAGEVYFGKVEYKDGHRIEKPRSMWKTGEGKHEPLWDMDTYYALVAERRRREKRMRHYNPNRLLTGLVHCGVCGAAMRRKRGDMKQYLTCRAKFTHFAMDYNEAERWILSEIERLYKIYRSNPPETKMNEIIKEQEELEKERQQVLDGWQHNFYKPGEVQQRLGDIDEKNAELERMKEAELDRLGNMIDLELADNLTNKLREMDAREGNTTLSRIVERIELSPDRLEITFR